MAGVLHADPIERLYRATTTPRLVTVPPMRFLMVDGQGDPDTSDTFEAAIQALYAVAYGAKFAIKKAGGPELKVAPLEALWWADDLGAFAAVDKAAWRWTAMIRQAPAVTEVLVERLAQDVASKKSIPIAARLRLQSIDEGPAAQILHVGPYSAEGPTIAALHEFIRAQGFTFDGHRQKHHEIYLGDPRRAAPERLKTIIRQPYSAA